MTLSPETLVNTDISGSYVYYQGISYPATVLINGGVGLYSPLNYVPKGHTFGTSQTLGGLYATLAIAQAHFPLAVSLSDQVDGECVIAAVNAASVANGTVVCPGGNIYRSRPIVIDCTKTAISGLANSTTFVPPNTSELRPCFQVVGSGVCTPISNLVIGGFSTPQYAGTSNGGVAHTKFTATTVGIQFIGIFSGTTGGQAVSYTSCSGIIIQNVYFINLDYGEGYDSAGSIYIITFRQCIWGNCNHGPSIPAPLSNSFENMQYQFCNSSVNNYAFYFILSYGSSGSYASQGADMAISGCSMDFNILPAVYQGCNVSAGTTTCNNRLLITNGSHWETSSTQSSTGARATCAGGVIIMRDTNWYEDGPSFPTYLWSCTNAATGYSRGSADGVNICSSSLTSPIFYTADSSMNVTGKNCWAQSNNPAAILGCGNGTIYSPGFPPATINGFTPSTGNSYNLPGQTCLLYAGSTGSGTSSSPYQFTVAADGSTADFIIGTTIEVMTVNGNYWQWVASGVTLVGTTTFGGSAGAQSKITKILANEWVITTA